MNNFTEEEVKAAKKTRDAIIDGSISEELKSVYMAGEICMWDELRKSHSSPPEGALKDKVDELIYIVTEGLDNNDDYPTVREKVLAALTTPTK